MKSKLLTSMFTVGLLGTLIAPTHLSAGDHKDHVRYTLVDLGPVGGPPGQPFALSNSSLIVGAVALPGTPSRSVLWYKGREFNISNPGLGGMNSVAFAVNDFGQVVGQSETSVSDPNGEDFCGFKASGLPSAGQECLSYIWQFGVMKALPTLRDESGARGTNAAANQINNRGEVVGMSETTAFDPNCPAPQIFQFKPVVWIEGKVHELPINSSDPDGIALAINDNGEVAGMSGVCSTFNVNTNLTNLNGVHALVWEHKKAIDLGNLGGTNPSPGGVSANSINNLGQVVGSSELSDNLTFHAFLWNKRAGMQDLGTLPGDSNSVGLHINDDGEVSGVSLDANFSPRAFLVRGGRMYDLNDLVPADSPLFLLDACFINNKGEIVGFGVDKTTGEAHGFMAEPKYW